MKCRIREPFVRGTWTTFPCPFPRAPLGTSRRAPARTRPAQKAPVTPPNASPMASAIAPDWPSAFEQVENKICSKNTCIISLEDL